MLNLLSRAALAPVVAALVVGAVPAHAATQASVPAAHVKECAGEGLANASAMTLVSTKAAKTSSGGYTSKARAWVYGVPGTTSRCVLVRTDGAKVRARKGQTSQTSVGYTVARSGMGVVDSGEALPLNHESFSYGGTSERTVTTAELVELVETVAIPEDVSDYYPPSLYGLAGHEVTIRLSTLELRLFSNAWTTTELAKPLTRVQRKKKQAAEVKVAKALYDERVAAATSVRDGQLALAATTTGLPAAWLTFIAEDEFAKTVQQATLAVKASTRIARQHATEAGKGSDTRETFAHVIELDVPLA